MKLDKFSVGSFVALLFLFKANFAVSSECSLNVQSGAGNTVNAEVPGFIESDPSEESQNRVLGRSSDLPSNKERQEIPRPTNADKIAKNNLFMTIAIVFFFLVMIVPAALFVHFKNDELDTF